MLHYGLAYLVTAIIAAIFGFGEIVAASAGIAKILFFVFLIAYLGSVVLRFARRA